MTYIFTVESEESGARLNTFLKKRFKGLFSSRDLSWSIEHNRCQINGKLERFLSRRLSWGDKVELMPEKRREETRENERILFEDEYFLAYNKPDGIPSTGEKGLSLQLGLEAVHRLDRDTTGIILLAKKKEALEALSDLFRKKKIQKTYLALVWGVPKEKSGVIENKLGIVSRRLGEVTWGVVTRHNGLPSKTVWRAEKSGQECTLMRCVPHTGRTHQIRVHMASIGHPLLGDAQYGMRKLHPLYKATRPFLHAETVSFKHPFTPERISIEAPLPEDFEIMQMRTIGSL